MREIQFKVFGIEYVNQIHYFSACLTYLNNFDLRTGSWRALVTGKLLVRDTQNR